MTILVMSEKLGVDVVLAYILAAIINYNLHLCRFQTLGGEPLDIKFPK